VVDLTDTEYVSTTCFCAEDHELPGCIMPDTYSNSGDRGGTVVKVLCYKSEGRWFDPR